MGTGGLRDIRIANTESIPSLQWKYCYAECAIQYSAERQES